MASTMNVTIGTYWKLVAVATGNGDVAASAVHPSDNAEWLISTSGQPSETLIGHPVPRDRHLAIILEGNEQLYFRNTDKGTMTAVVTFG